MRIGKSIKQAVEDSCKLGWVPPRDLMASGRNLVPGGLKLEKVQVFANFAVEGVDGCQKGLVVV